MISERLVASTAKASITARGWAPASAPDTDAEMISAIPVLSMAIPNGIMHPIKTTVLHSTALYASSAVTIPVMIMAAAPVSRAREIGMPVAVRARDAAKISTASRPMPCLASSSWGLVSRRRSWWLASSLKLLQAPKATIASPAEKGVSEKSARDSIWPLWWMRGSMENVCRKPISLMLLPMIDALGRTISSANPNPSLSRISFMALFGGEAEQPYSITKWIKASSDPRKASS